MKVGVSVTLLWAFAMTTSGILAAFLSDLTLKKKKSALITAGGWTLSFAVLFAVLFGVYSINISRDEIAIFIVLVFLCVTAQILYTDYLEIKLFMEIITCLIAYVATFFFCGITLSFVYQAPKYNVTTISVFIGIKLIIFTLIYLLYRAWIAKPITSNVNTLGVHIRNHLPISVGSFIGFSLFGRLTNKLGIMPGVPGKQYYFIMFYTIICTLLSFEFWQIFSSVSWSSRALKTEAELGVASKIQSSILPYTFPAFPGREEFDIYALMHTAKEVGGDFYDFFLIGEDKLAVVMADVSGKGVPAALFMMIARTLIKNDALSDMEVSDVFEKVNKQLYENNDAEMFVTAFLGVFDIKEKKLVFVNAGHNPPLIRRENGEFEWVDVKPGFVLAGLDSIRYQTQEVPFAEGDELFLYTDGVTEAVNTKLELYSDERLHQTLNGIPRVNTIDETVHLVKRSIEQFAEGAEQADDITMLMLRCFKTDGQRTKIFDK